jgi:hypothetical protein
MRDVVLLAASHGQPSLRKMYNKKIECYDMMLMLWLSGRRMADEVIQYRNKNTFSIFSNFSRKRRMAHALIGWSVTAAASRSQSAKKHVKARNEMRGGGQGEEAVKSVSSVQVVSVPPYLSLGVLRACCMPSYWNHSRDSTNCCSPHSFIST